MAVIKRYSNRKLYDTDSKRYVTLEDLAEFVRRGDNVQVVDHVTGEDLTATILLQVIFEEQKKIGGLLPQVFLTRLIRAGGDAVNTFRGRLVSLDPFQVVDEEIRRRLQMLEKSGIITAEERQRMESLLIHKPAQADVIHIPVISEEETPQEEVDPEEVGTLLRQVDALEQELARLQAGDSHPA